MAMIFEIVDVERIQMVTRIELLTGVVGGGPMSLT